MLKTLIFCYSQRYEQSLSVITVLSVPWHIDRRGHVCLWCEIALQNISHGRNCNQLLLAQIRAAQTVSLISPVAAHSFQHQNCYQQGTDTHRRWAPICSNAHICGGRWEQLGEHVYITSHIYWRGPVCIWCRTALQCSFHGRNCNPLLLVQIQASEKCTDGITCGRSRVIMYPC